MSKILLLLVTLCACSWTVLSAADSAPAAPLKRAPNPSLIPIEDVPGLPRVLLIGDSISMGYTLTVRELLKGKANVHRIPANGGPTSRGIENIEKWLGDGNWDVIHFNWGIHDLKIMPDGNRQVEAEGYAANLRGLLAKMQATGARLIWASITPIPKGLLEPPRRFGDEAEYNQIAEKIMKSQGVRINDLHGYVLPEFAKLQKPQDLHYLPEGYAFLGKKVAAEIEAELK